MGQNCTSTARRSAAKTRQYHDEDDDVDSLQKPSRYIKTPDSPSLASTTATTSLSGYISVRLDSNCKYMLSHLFGLASKKPSLKVLDIGCGSGSLTVDFGIALPSASITGIDVCSAVLSSAKVFAQHQSVPNVQFQQADAHHLPFPDGSFDVVHVHQALAHFSDRKKAIKEMLRVTRKGGIVCMKEGDLTTARFWPEDKVLEECFDVIREVHGLDGGAVDAGMRLRSWVREAGVGRRKVKGSCSAVFIQTAEERRMYGGHWPGRCAAGVFRDRAIEVGVTSKRLDEYALAWKKWIENPEGVFSMMHGEVIVTV